MATPSFSAVLRFGGLGFALLLGACSSQEEQSGHLAQAVIYGSDDRREPFQLEGTPAQRLQESAAALIRADRLVAVEGGRVEVAAPSLQEFAGVCADARFAQQPCAAECSATLVGEQLVLTAGHCLQTLPCSELRVVFDYAVGEGNELAPLEAAAVFRCQRVLAQQFDATVDYAVIELDRPALGRAPAVHRVGTRPVASGAALVFAGFPTGLPLKIAEGASVNRARPAELDYFSASLDAFPGSSGGGVFLAASMELVGVVARGPQPAYARFPGETCARPVQVSGDLPGGVESTYLARALTGLCAAAEDETLCACGNGSCQPDRREDSRSCPEDCGAACGDGVCNGAENGDTCYADCGSCGNAVCEAREASRLNCCADCGCPGGFTCGASRCELELGNVNGDDAVNAADAEVLSRALSGGVDEYYEPRVADVDCNGSVNAADAQHLLDAESGLALPCRRFVAVAAGASHSCALSVAGNVHCWGAALDGQLGHASTRSVGDDERASAAPAVDVGGPVQAITTGRQHSCALLRNGHVRCWGAGAQGQLGQGNLQTIGDDEAPASIPAVALGERAIGIAAGGFHTCAVLESGRVRCWGDNTFGQLALGHTRRVGDDELPVAAEALQLPLPAVAVVAGLSHSCALLNDATVRCWGLNALGQLGYGTPLNQGDDEAVGSLPAVSLGGPVAALAAGWTSTCAVLVGGAVRCWGDGSGLQLGNGAFPSIGDNEVPTASPAQVFGAPAVEVTVGEQRACARLASGNVHCWGSNAFGQLGQGHRLPLAPGTLGSSVPAIALGGPASAIAAGGQHGCAVVTGSVRCWGRGDAGQLGYGTKGSVGDDELPASVGAVPIFEENQRLLERVNPHQLSVFRLNESSDAKSSGLGLYVVNHGPDKLENFRLLYLFDSSEGAAPVGVQDHYTPWSDLRLESDDNGLGRLVLHFNQRALEPGQTSSWGAHGGEKFRLHFVDWRPTWDERNDYSAVERRARGRYHATSRVQIIDHADRVLYGWARAARRD